MSNIIKQPSIKLIPSDPATNTILIIYCVSNTGASVPYKSSWRKINPKRNKVQDIKNSNGSSYRCSPLDLDCIIEVTVYFQHQRQQMSRVLQSNVVKISRELKEKKTYMKELILCRISVDELFFQTKIKVQDEALQLTCTGNAQNLSYTIKMKDINVQLDSNQLAFKIVFSERFQQFLNFATQLGIKNQKNFNNFIIVSFGSDFHRDIILLAIAQQLLKQANQTQQTTSLGNQNQNEKQKPKQMVRQIQIPQGGHNKNKSQTTFSPTNAARERFKLANKFSEMNASFNNLHNLNQQIEKKSQRTLASTVSKKQPKSQQVLQGTKEKERQYLSVFQEDQLQLLGPPRTVSNDIPAKPKPTHVQNHHQNQNPNDQPSINLRGSFEELQKSFNSNLNEQIFDRIFKIQDGQQTKKLQQSLNKLKSQNQQLKRQVQSINPLIKQNNTLKKKQLEMKEEINRLQMQRKVILTDKLRCQVNWHKEIQQKQQMKKQIQHLREVMKGNFHSNANFNFGFERTGRTQSIHEVNAFERRLQNRQFTQMNRDVNRSPNSSFYR